MEFRRLGGECDRLSPRACYSNAIQLACQSPRRFVYVEGQGVPKLAGFPVEHAWVLDREGRVYDPTWRDGLAYFGIPFRLGFVLKSIRKSRECSIIENWEHSYPVYRLSQNRWKARGFTC
jgi:hypothetical protein